MAKHRIETDPRKRPDYVARGSAAHKALLDMTGDNLKPEEAEARTASALAVKSPEPSAKGARKQPISRHTYDRLEPIEDGWARTSP